MSDPLVEAIKWISIIASVFLMIGAILLACSSICTDDDEDPGLRRLFKKLPKVNVVGRRIYIGLALIIIALIVFLPLVLVDDGVKSLLILIFKRRFGSVPSRLICLGCNGSFRS